MKLKRHSLIAILALSWLASCDDAEFSADNKKINPHSITDRPECTDQQKDSVGAHIAFVIDNSASNGSTRIATDCPGMQNSNGRVYCSQATMRETATMAGVQYLQTLTDREPNNPLAESFLSLISYPSVNGRTTHITSVSSKTASSTFSDYLDFTRNPNGDTPLYQGLSGGSRALSGALSADERAKVIIIVTDGFNTDRGLNQIYSLAQQFRSMGGKIYAITNTDGKNRAERVADYRKLIGERSNKYSQEFTNQEYIGRVVGENGHNPILKEISDAYFEIDNASEMPAVMEKIVINGAINCK